MPEASTVFHPGQTPEPTPGSKPPAGPPPQPPAADPRVGITLAGRYRIERRLATGGMATVYRARDTQLHRDVAVKMMHPSLADDPGFAERFRTEAKSAGRLNHPNIVSVYDYGSSPEGNFIVMELADGVTLRSLLERFGRIERSMVRRVVESVSHALDHAHASGVVHRDVKPENILVLPNGDVKVLDFGIAKAVGTEPSNLTTNRPIGTVAYVAPEQLSGADVDGRADVYALGAMTFEMLTGNPPFRGETPQAIAASRMQDPVLLAGVAPDIDAAIAKATAGPPGDRFATPGAFARALNGESSAAAPDPSVTTTAHLPTPPVPQPVEVLPFQARLRRHARRRFRIGLALAAALVVAAGVVYAALPRPTTVPDVREQSVAQARAMIERAGLEVGETTEAFHDVIPAGSVISTTPEVGTVINDETPVQLVVSKGPQLFEVPPVIGKPLDEARVLMTQTGFTLATDEEQHHDTVAHGAVISIAPDVDQARRGTAFTAAVSLGPPPVAIPDVNGRPVAEAREAIEGVGFSFTTTDEYSEDVASGMVIRTDPGGGGQAPRGSTITAVVSLGPRPFPMPNLVGSTLEEARGRAAELGLVVSNEYPVPGSGSPSGHVQGQNPPPGTNIQRGSGIDLYYAT